MTPQDTDVGTGNGQHYPVAIAGAGPVGILVALELAHHGVRSLLFDRSPEPTKFPKMDITNGRSMELLRRLGIADQVREIGVAPRHSFDVLWALPDGEAPFGRWDLPSVNQQKMRLTSRNDGTMPLEADQRAPQSAFETMGRDLCRAHPLIDFREGFAFERFSEDSDGIEMVMSDVANGQLHSIRASYLVGADGAGSRVRRQTGIELEELPRMPRNYMVHFRSTDREVLHRFGPFWHYFVMGSVIISQDEQDTWTFHTPLFGGVPEGGITDPGAMIAERTGLRPRIDEVLLTSIWQPRFALATRYSNGRVFLAGDAAHQVFPTGGYGMNTGVGDAIDIGWKLAAVVNGWAGKTLLESYEAERRPVGATNRDYARRHLGVHIGVVERAQAGASRETLREFVESSRGENEFDGIELGYRYTQSPVVVHETEAAPQWSETDYIPSTWPGARPPSMILADGSALFDHFGTAMTLLDFKGDAAALVETAQRHGVPVVHLPVADPAIRAVWERNLVLVRPDQHVAWRGDELPSEAEWLGVLDRVCGRVTVGS